MKSVKIKYYGANYLKFLITKEKKENPRNEIRTRVRKYFEKSVFFPNTFHIIGLLK